MPRHENSQCENSAEELGWNSRKEEGEACEDQALKENHEDDTYVVEIQYACSYPQKEKEC